jgi:glycosyltransferase A (GT-A) superfamily protein (DUF2064 family)
VKFWLLPEIIDRPDITLDPARVDFQPQGGGDHGQRLGRAISQGFGEGFQKVAAIGTDCIELNHRHEAVLGPTPGGRHHFIGLRKPLPGLLDSVPWASSAAYQVSVARATEQAVLFYELPPLPEVLTSTEYKVALDGPLGPALRKAMEQLEA